jgi:hypothetical protein
MIIFRRFAVLAVLAFWQGGFVFYAAVVVPVAMSVLHPPSLQAFVTMTVTRYLNFAGVVALAVLALDIVLARDERSRRRFLRWASWLLMTAALIVLFWIHPRLMAYMDSHSQVILDREALYPLHRIYLLVSAAQWLCAMLFIVLMLRGWQEEDLLKREV